MPDFNDLIGGSKIYTEDERKEILTDSFMSGIKIMVDELMLSKEDIQDFREWYEDQTEWILSEMKKVLSENELDIFLQWTSTPLAEKAQKLQLSLQQKIAPKIMNFLTALEEKKIEKRREKRNEKSIDEWSVD